MNNEVADFHNLTVRNNNKPLPHIHLDLLGWETRLTLAEFYISILYRKRSSRNYESVATIAKVLNYYHLPRNVWFEKWRRVMYWNHRPIKWSDKETHYSSLVHNNRYFSTVAGKCNKLEKLISRLLVLPRHSLICEVGATSVHSNGK